VCWSDAYTGIYLLTDFVYYFLQLSQNYLHLRRDVWRLGHHFFSQSIQFNLDQPNLVYLIIGLPVVDLASYSNRTNMITLIQII